MPIRPALRQTMRTLLPLLVATILAACSQQGESMSSRVERLEQKPLGSIDAIRTSGGTTFLILTLNDGSRCVTYVKEGGVACDWAKR